MARIGKAKKEEIRKKILSVSERMIFEQGYDKTSTSQIAKEVGIAEGTVFNYFKSKAEILVEIISSEYWIDIERPEIEGISTGVVDLYVNYCQEVMNKIFFLPKKIILELSMTLLNATRKKPGIIKKLAELDFQFIEEVEQLNIELMEKGILKKCDAKMLAENIYSVIAYEVILYLYDESATKDLMMDNIAKKINFILEHRLA